MLLKKTNFLLFKRLLIKKNKITGINNTGRKTLYHRGGGVKNNFRVLDFSRYICFVPALVMTIEFDPNRTALISLLVYSNGSACNTLAVENVIPGMLVNTIVASNISFFLHSSRLGDTASLNILKPGIYINSIEPIWNMGLKIARACGNFAKYVSLTKDNYAIVKLKSKVLLKINANNLVTTGVILTHNSMLKIKRKNAGTTRRLGWRPHVRGVAMNPVDHPHGGGVGKTSGGRPSVTPWALMTKGRKTKKTKKNYAKTYLKG